MPKDKDDSLLGLDLTGQDLDPIEPIDQEVAKLLDTPSELTPFQRLPKHLQRKSLKSEEDMWTKIMDKRQESVFIEYSSEQQAKAKRTRYYMARSYIAAMMLDDYPDIVQEINRYSINLITNTELDKTYLQFLRLPNTDELLDELPS